MKTVSAVAVKFLRILAHNLLIYQVQQIKSEIKKGLDFIKKKWQIYRNRFLKVLNLQENYSGLGFIGSLLFILLVHLKRALICFQF